MHKHIDNHSDWFNRDCKYYSISLIGKSHIRSIQNLRKENTMTPKEIKFEDLKDLKYGDLIIMKEVLFKEETPYVFMSNVEDKSFYFINGGGASLMINCQDTIDGFEVKLIDNTHPSWEQALSDHGKQLGKMLSMLEEPDGVFDFGKVLKEL